jgi:hypothetical protein
MVQNGTPNPYVGGPAAKKLRTLDALTEENEVHSKKHRANHAKEVRALAKNILLEDFLARLDTPCKSTLNNTAIDTPGLGTEVEKMASHEDISDSQEESTDRDTDRNNGTDDTEILSTEEEILADDDEISGSDDNIWGDVDENSDVGSESEAEADELPDTEDDEYFDLGMMDNFKKYTEHAAKNYCGLKPEYEAGIELLRMLANKRAPLNLYDAVFKWHTNNLKASKFVTRKTLLRKLNERYNMGGKEPFVKKLELPHSKARIKLVCHDAQAQMESLLTDPQIKDEDWLFFDDNPLQGPPDHFVTVLDINTGLAYRETYARLIAPKPMTDTGRYKALLPIMWYMDGAVTGQFDNLPIEALKFTLGILKGQTRDKAFAWRNIGYVTKFLKEKTEAQDILVDSGHINANIYVSDSDTEDEQENTEQNGEENEAEDAESDTNSVTNFLVNTQNQEQGDIDLEDSDDEADDMDPKLPDCNAQDLHVMLEAMLESYQELQASGGFDWDFPYRGTVYKLRFIPFVLFIKGDTVEHDKHCGSYGSQTKGVKQLCRYCCCPNEHTDEAYRRDPLKSQELIEPLVMAEDAVTLQGMSQHLLWNCWYEIGFGLHNKRGVHGACPLELLHWIQLGKYKYQRSMFFAQSGKESILSDKLNAVAKTMGLLFKRQSDRNLPRTNFAKGIRKGKLMAHEMSGLIVVLVAVLRSSKGRDLCLNQSRGTQKEFLGSLEKIKDWILLLETMLQFEVWLNKPELEVFLVKRARTKVRELMGMEKQVGRREDGMKFKTFNFHAVLHVPDDILNFGVPSNVNTKANEMHHKDSKTAAKQTQRRPETFDLQCGQRIHDLNVVDLGLQEIDGRPLWTYFGGYDHPEPEEKEQQVQLGGTRIEYFFSQPQNKHTYQVISKMKDKHRLRLGSELENFFKDLHQVLGDEQRILRIFTEHNRWGQIFCGSPRYLGKPWRDWVMIDFGEDGYWAAQIWCFLDLRDLPQVADDSLPEPAVYAVVEYAEISTNTQELEMSDLFVPYIKTMTRRPDGSLERKFYLCDVESFDSPACLIPDIGNENQAAFLRLLPKSDWSDQFEDWLRAPHYQEFTAQD